MKTLKITKIILFISLALLLISISLYLFNTSPFLLKNVSYNYYKTVEGVRDVEIYSVVFYSDGHLLETLPNGETRTKKYSVNGREIYIDDEDGIYGYINSSWWISLDKYSVKGVNNNGIKWSQEWTEVACHPLRTCEIIATTIVAPLSFIIFMVSLIFLIVKSRKIKKQKKLQTTK